MRKLISILAFALLSVTLGAQEAIKVQGQNIVALGEQFTISFVIDTDQSNRPTDFRWSPGDDFQLVWGPQTGTSSSTVIRNGKATTSSQYTFSYILIARKEGKFQLPTASATYNGKQISSAPFSLEVVSGGSASSGSAGTSSSKPSAQTGDISSNDLFMRLSLSRSSAVIGEPVTAVLKLYQRVDISGFENVRFPVFTGFWNQTLETPSNIEFRREVIDGTIYNSALLRSWVLVPQQAGELVIEPAELTCLVNIAVQHRNQSIFDSFFDDNYRTIRKRITSPQVKLPVSKLPAGAPENFNGGVGKFTMTASLSRDSLSAHEAASLLITISGTGNVSLLEAPKVVFPTDFEVYDVKTSEKTSQGGTSGSKTFEYPFIPRSRGEFTLDPVQWSYFDVGSRKWVTLDSQAIDMFVSGESTAQASSGQTSGLRLPERSGVRNLSEDIRFIRTGKPSLTKGSPMLVGRASYKVIILLVIALSAGCFLYRRRKERRLADVAGSRGRRATKMAMKRLSAAKVYLDRNLGSAFYEELHKALLGFVADKFNMPQEDLDKDTIAARLAERGIPEALIGDFSSLLDDCEFARYAPGSGEEALKDHYDKAVKLISSIASALARAPRQASTGPAALMLALFMAFSATANATPADSLWTAGVQAYTDGDWTGAVSSWQAIHDDGYVSSVLSYNLGNAYFKAGDLARAILNYERSLKADPSFADARNNLDYANSLVQDRIDVVPEFLLKSWARNICYSLSSNVWAVLSLLFFIAFCALALVFGLSSGSSRRKGFYGGIVAIILFGITLGFSLWQKNDFGKADGAIVTMPVSAVKNSPAGGSSARDLFVLHEGVKVKVLDKVGSFTNIELSDGRQGWIKSSDIEII